MADDADALAAEAAEAADDRRVLAELAVAGERCEFGDQAGDGIEAMRALRMPGDLRLLPRREPRIELLEREAGFCFQAIDFVADGNGAAAFAHGAQFLDLGFEFGHRLFEVEIAAHLVPARVMEAKN